MRRSLFCMSLVMCVFAASCGQSSGNGKKPDDNGVDPTNSGDSGEADGTVHGGITGVKLPAYASSVATGKIAGNAWTVAAGSYQRGWSSEGGTRRIVLYNDTPIDPWSGQPTDPCDTFASSPDSTLIMLTVDDKVGEQTLLLQHRTMTFVARKDDQPWNIITDMVKVRLDEIGTETVKGAISGRYDDKTFINGTFELKYCPARL